ncbi:sulfotransferase domain-containing protein [Paraglaciecola mesophila]|jgi:hypothetical protein|uniref:Sulfotransferase domain-containing protein n=1 Tax=Paraglaciecola mesophila TaxID=197222 RepID=A0ABU9SX49_9ALTE
MDRVKQYLRKIKVVASLYFIRLLNKIKPRRFISPSILLLSYPRSGSSWAGEILATSPQLAYLREPVTQPYLKRFGGEQAVFSAEDNHKDISIYQKLADDAFGGVPSVHRGVVDHKRDFLPFSNATSQKLLIKEVNPAAASFYCKHYKPFLLVLLRHPAAVALSFHERGWLKRHSELLDGESELDEWGRFGQLYGTFLADAVDVVNHYQNSKIIKYEALVNDPKQQYLDIFADCGVGAPEGFDSVIEQYCYSKVDLSSGYQTERNSKLTAEKWKNKLSIEQINSLRKGFLDTRLDFYREPSDWLVSSD